MGLDVLCDGRRAFVNGTRDVLLNDHVTLLPSDQTIVEILESVEPAGLVLAACQRLQEAGYLIALDDFVANDQRDPLIELADILKVDLKRTTIEERAAMIKRYGPWRCRMLAEKVETAVGYDWWRQSVPGSKSPMNWCSALLLGLASVNCSHPKCHMAPRIYFSWACFR